MHWQLRQPAEAQAGRWALATASRWCEHTCNDPPPKFERGTWEALPGFTSLPVLYMTNVSRCPLTEDGGGCWGARDSQRLSHGASAAASTCSSLSMAGPGPPSQRRFASRASELPEHAPCYPEPSTHVGARRSTVYEPGVPRQRTRAGHVTALHVSLPHVAHAPRPAGRTPTQMTRSLPGRRPVSNKRTNTPAPGPSTETPRYCHWCLRAPHPRRNTATSAN
jgi:hypothetical protein